MLGAAAIGASCPGLASAGDAKSGAGQKPTLVVIYLRGGADAVNVIVPYAEKLYRTKRPTIAIPGPDSKAEKRVIPLDDTFGLNPNLKGISQLYKQGKCAPIVCVGSNHNTRSHFSAQDYMERGAPGMANVRTGWLDRYLYATRKADDPTLRAFALQPQLPRSLRGDYPVLALPSNSSSGTMEIFRDLYGEMPGMTTRDGNESAQQTKLTIQQAGSKTITQIKALNKLLATPDAPGVKYPATQFGGNLRRIAKVIKANKGLEVTALDYRGWDHHRSEGPVNGVLGTKLADLDGSLKAFADDLGDRMDKVQVLVMSEFGRTVKENGNKGTDHGHGGFMLAIGGMVRGGKVYGKWTGLDDSKLWRKRDLPVHTDFRNVFAETLQKTFGYDGIKAGLFPEYTRANPPLNILNQVEA